MNTQHPCFNPLMHKRFGRIHLPVAPKCNVSCGFCDRRFSCVNESRPGVSAQVMRPQEAFLQACTAIEKAHKPIAVIGIAGPGDPLANPGQSLETLERIHKAYPHILLCLSTNGLALPEHVQALARLGVRHLTVTVNAVNPSIGAQIYTHVQVGTEKVCGLQGADFLLKQQEHGIKEAKALGMTVKVNTVVIPQINYMHVVDIAQKVASWGADLHNCIGLLPVQGTPLARFGEPDSGMLASIRQRSEHYLPQMRHCTRCRADACGLLGENTFLHKSA